MKKRLIVLASWATPIEKTWSGSAYSAAKALEDYYDVIYLDLHIGSIHMFIRKLSNYPYIGLFFGFLYELISQIKANRIVSKYPGVPVLEIPFSVHVKNPHYFYQDMTYSAGYELERLKKKHPWIYNIAVNNVGCPTDTKFREKFQIRNYRKADGILYMSHWVYDFMSSQYPSLKDKMHHVGGGSHMDITKVDISAKAGNKFLFIGRAYQRKAGDLVIEAFKKLRKELMPEAELHIAGPLSNPAPDEQGIFYYGDTDFEKTRELFNKCDVFVMPSRFEAYGLVFIEALIYGLPCVARRYFEMPYFIEEDKTGVLIDDDNTDELCQKMYETINNKSMIQYVQSHQKDFVENYTWSAVASRISKIIG